MIFVPSHKSASTNRPAIVHLSLNSITFHVSFGACFGMGGGVMTRRPKGKGPLPDWVSGSGPNKSP